MTTKFACGRSNPDEVDMGTGLESQATQEVFTFIVFVWTIQAMFSVSDATVSNERSPKYASQSLRIKSSFRVQEEVS